MYWAPKLKHANKYLDRRLVEKRKLDGVELAFLALKMIARDPGTQISFVKASLLIYNLSNYDGCFP